MGNLVLPILENSIEYFKNVQNADGGFPYNDEGAPSGVWTTSGVLWAIASINPNIKDKYIFDAMEYLITNQNSDGLMPYTKKGDVGCIDATAQFILGSVKFKYITEVSKYKRALQKAIFSLINFSNECRWGTVPNSRPIISSTAFSLLALNSVQLLNISPNGEINNIVLSGVNRLINCRNDDGGWGIFEGDESKAGTTALALLAVETCIPNEIKYKDEIVNPARTFILNTQTNCTWDDIIERDAGFTVIRLSLPYCLSALIKSGCTFDDINFQKGFMRLLEQFSDGHMHYKDSNIETWSTRDGILALCNIRDSILKFQLVKLIDSNIQLTEARIRAESIMIDLKKSLQDYRISEDIRVRQKVNEKYAGIKKSYFVMRIVLLLSTFCVFGLALIVLQDHLIIKEDQLLGVAGIMIAFWGVIATILFRKG